MAEHWRKAFDCAFLGSWAFNNPKKPILAVIESTDLEMVTGENGRQERCLVAHFAGGKLKPLILNRTNCKAISTVAGSCYREDWPGVAVLLTVQRVQAFGETVDAVRVKPERVCGHCEKRITGAGKMDAAGVAEWTKGAFGVTLCAACARERAGKNGEQGGGSETAD